MKRVAFFLTFIFLIILTNKVLGVPTQPWVNPNQGYTHYWTYNFDDANIPPTITSEGGNWDPGSDPDWTITGPVTIVNGHLGIHNATQDSVADIKILIPNQHYDYLDKYFWFSYDWYSSSGYVAHPTYGTNDTNSSIINVECPDNLNTNNHIEGFVIFHPQPDNEWLNIHLGAPANSTIWIDNLKIGSTCIPEPSSIFLFTSSLISFILLRKKLKR